MPLPRRVPLLGLIFCLFPSSRGAEYTGLKKALDQLCWMGFELNLLGEGEDFQNCAECSHFLLLERNLIQRGLDCCLGQRYGKGETADGLMGPNFYSGNKCHIWLMCSSVGPVLELAYCIAC